MANRFEKGTWPDRQVQYPSRRRLTATAESDVWDVERVEGEIIEAGKAFGETNMENLENRIYNAFETLESSDVKLTDASNLFTATTVDGAFTELFQYAGNGKTAIATAIGSEASPSNTFPQLANTISNGKLQIANALGNAALQAQTFAYLASLTADFRNQALTKKRCKIGSASISETGFSNNTSQTINFNFGFNPSAVIVSNVSCSLKSTYSGVVINGTRLGFDNLGGAFTVTSINSTSFQINYSDNDTECAFVSSTAFVIGIE